MRSSLPLLVLLLATRAAFAHNLMTDPRMAGGQLRVEVFYDDGTPAQDAQVTVRSGDDKVAEGRTDEKGVWVWEAPVPGKYTVHGQSLGHASRPEAVEIKQAELAPPARTADAAAPPESASRAARTRTPWRNLALGLGLIGAAVVFARLFRRSKTTNAPKDSA
jgi:hypothetical protein